MRLVSFSDGPDGRVRPGIEIGGGVVAVEEVARAAGLDLPAVAMTTNRDVLGLGRAVLDRLSEAAAGATVVPLDAVRLGPPVPNPEKIVCLGLNYRDHAEEAGLQPPAAPMFFAKYPNSLAGPADDIVPPVEAERVDYEAELAIVIGVEGRRIAAENALDHVGGVMALNDVSARDLQMANPLWTGGKAIDTFAPCGPALVTLDEVGDVQELGLRTRVNGELVQDGTTASMIFGVAQTIAFLSRIMTLRVGDIVATGTPAGVGASRTPPLFLADGDEVEVEVDRVGTLRNRVVAAA